MFLIVWQCSIIVLRVTVRTPSGICLPALEEEEELSQEEESQEADRGGGQS